SQGNADAPVTLVEYGDYECPYCGQAHPIVKSLQRSLGDQLRFVFRNFPLPAAHPHALHASIAAEAVAELGGSEAYWKMHDAIFENQRALDDTHLVRYASDSGVSDPAVAQALADELHVDRIQRDLTGGARSGVNGTPTFFINGARFDGDWTDAAGFEAALVAAGGASVRR
ncbi:MAG: DsbA family protein, partial [Anaerolineae bacterium]|nr:DsbA family protein [Gemmatimonadaceae bacterium]